MPFSPCKGDVVEEGIIFTQRAVYLQKNTDSQAGGMNSQKEMCTNKLQTID